MNIVNITWIPAIIAISYAISSICSCSFDHQPPARDRQLGIAAHCDLERVADVERQVKSPAH